MLTMKSDIADRSFLEAPPMTLIAIDGDDGDGDGNDDGDDDGDDDDGDDGDDDAGDDDGDTTAWLVLGSRVQVLGRRH